VFPGRQQTREEDGSDPVQALGHAAAVGSTAPLFGPLFASAPIPARTPFRSRRHAVSGLAPLPAPALVFPAVPG